MEQFFTIHLDGRVFALGADGLHVELRLNHGERQKFAALVGPGISQTAVMVVMAEVLARATPLVQPVPVPVLPS